MTVKAAQRVAWTMKIEDEAAAREDKSAAMDDQREAIDNIHEQRSKKAQEEAQAIRDEFGGRFWGTIFGGPLIGTLIGWGIGALASNNNDDNAALAEKRAGLADLERAQASDEMHEAVESSDNAAQREDQIDKFMSEIRNHDREMSN